MIQNKNTKGDYSPILGNKANLTQNFTTFQSYTVTINKVNSNEENQLVECNSETITLDFASETLSVTRLLEKVRSCGIDLSVITASIEGKNQKGKYFCASNEPIHAIKADGYIRNFSINYGCKNISVGGNNATLEDIASNKIKLHIPKDVFDTINSVNGFNLEGMQNTINLMKQLHFAREFESAINVAKALKNKLALKLHIQYLDDLSSPHLISIILEGFRKFTSIYKADKELAKQAINVLDRFIKKNHCNGTFKNLIIYAIEALGYVNKYSSTSQPVIDSLIIQYIRSGLTKMHPHTLWASAVALNDDGFIRHKKLLLSDLSKYDRSYLLDNDKKLLSA